MAALKIKKGDRVQVIAGSFKGKIGKVVAVVPQKRAVKVEGLNIVRRHSKPTALSGKGGAADIHKPLDISKVALVHPAKKYATSRVGYIIKNDGSKARVYRQAKRNGKYEEID